MRDGFRNYDRWKLMSPEDEEDAKERQRLKDDRDIDKADEMRDREKDDAFEFTTDEEYGQDAGGRWSK
jgi:hypothetical protein